LLRSFFGSRFLSFCRLNDDKIGQIPRKWWFSTAVRVALFRLGSPVAFVVAAIVGAAIPPHDDGQLAGLRLQRIEAAQRAAAYDDFERLLLLAGRGRTAGGRRRFRWHFLQRTYRHGLKQSV